MSDSLAKFQQLLAELFQFDAADLDFGIYRIMNHKRYEVQRFITEDLPAAVAHELDRDALAAQAQAAQRAAGSRRADQAEFWARTRWPPTATWPRRTTARRWAGSTWASGKAGGARSRDAIETSIYNHLICFFSRYYQDGDFISKRRYSKRERYAIPYNGEEVYLHWANHDQYYVKTAEHFTDYAFTAPNGVTVHFKLQAADVEQNNVKGEKRFFLPRPAETRRGTRPRRQLIIPCEYRPLNGQEAIAYGQRNQQEAIIARALEEIPKRLSPQDAAPALAALSAERRTDGRRPARHLSGAPPAPVHPAQHGRLLHPQGPAGLSGPRAGLLPEERGAGPGRPGGGRRGPRRGLVPDPARHQGRGRPHHRVPAPDRGIPEAAVGEAQVRGRDQLLHHRGRHRRGLLPEIAACDAQWAEWRALSNLTMKRNAERRGRTQSSCSFAFLQAHPTLVLDTRHFDRAFVDRLLGSFDDLDEMTDGLLVHSENWQALNLLMEKYREQGEVHLYRPAIQHGERRISSTKIRYQHSSWMSMITNRVEITGRYLETQTSSYCMLTMTEFGDLLPLLFGLFGQEGFVEEMVWQKAYGGGFKTKWINSLHEYVQCFTSKPASLPRTLSCPQIPRRRDTTD